MGFYLIFNVQEFNFYPSNLSTWVILNFSPFCLPIFVMHSCFPHAKICRTAYDVTLTDDSWSPDVFDVVSGNTSTSWERLDA